MNWTKAASLVLGFGGALVVLNPSEKIEFGTVLALGSGLFFALYLVSTRQAAKDTAALKTLAFQCTLGTLLLTPQAGFSWSTPGFREAGLFLFMGLTSAISHVFAIRAFRNTEASILAPLVYVELVGAICLGLLVFGEIPSAMTLVGGGLIVLGGLVLIKKRHP